MLKEKTLKVSQGPSSGCRKQQVGLDCSQGTPGAIFQSSIWAGFYFPFANHLSEENELPLLKKPRKEKNYLFRVVKRGKIDILIK